MTQTTLIGGCLCGTVRYEVIGEPAKFYHCHCSRCRKSTGTGHATNMLITDAQIRYTQGEEQVKRYKVPESERFTRVFCPECGAPVARYVQELDAVVIPAGSLDEEPPIKPQARIFWDSRSSWSCTDDVLPTFAELP